MSPARIPYDAPHEVAEFFQTLRTAQLAALDSRLAFSIRQNCAESRGGGDSAYKRHLHTSGYDDVKIGFEFNLWPDDLNNAETRNCAALGLYITAEPYACGLLPHLRGGLLMRPVRDSLAALGLSVDAAAPQNKRDTTTGAWVLRQSVPLGNYDDTMGRRYGTLLGQLMNAVRGPIIELVRSRAPDLMKR